MVTSLSVTGVEIINQVTMFFHCNLLVECLSWGKYVTKPDKSSYHGTRFLTLLFCVQWWIHHMSPWTGPYQEGGLGIQNTPFWHPKNKLFAFFIHFLTLKRPFRILKDPLGHKKPPRQILGMGLTDQDSPFVGPTIIFIFNIISRTLSMLYDDINTKFYNIYNRMMHHCLMQCFYAVLCGEHVPTEHHFIAVI